MHQVTGFSLHGQLWVLTTLEDRLLSETQPTRSALQMAFFSSDSVSVLIEKPVGLHSNF